MNTKICTKCKVKKELTKFHKNKSNKDGVRSECKTCHMQHYTDNNEAYSQQRNQWYLDHKIELKQRRNIIKNDVFNHYGNKCEVCGEDNLMFLDIDHINGGGCKQHIKGVINRLYNWLIKNNFPQGFQTLCDNCNWKKHILNLNPVIFLQAKEYRVKLKTTVYDHYGNKCSCCNKTDIDILSIDHINGGGLKHTKKVGGRGAVFYRWIIKNNFPTDLQLLCRNCNVGKHRNHGVCPHKQS